MRCWCSLADLKQAELLNLAGNTQQWLNAELQQGQKNPNLSDQILTITIYKLWRAIEELLTHWNTKEIGGSLWLTNPFLEAVLTVSDYNTRKVLL
jgi:hypothetical protein